MKSHALVALALSFAALASAEWAMAPEVPIDRLIVNYTKSLKEVPNNAHAAYVLARLHSYAFATKKDKIGIYSERGKLAFPAYETLQVMPAKPYLTLDAATKKHLTESLRLYALAIKYEPSTPVHHLGLAWMQEQAAPYAASLGKIEGVATKTMKSKDWLAMSLATYRATYAKFLRQELNGPKAMYEIPDAYVSQESAEGIVRIVTERKIGAFAKGEETGLRANIKKFEGMRAGITPIVFSLSGAPFSDMINLQARVGFNLAGDGVEREWPWVKPGVSFLAWDPKGTGRITSGQQLFGNATFWMFFRDGYEALASLDDDRDGWLKGKELKGIVVWTDVDGDGVSDSGEVIAVERLGVTAVRTSADGSEGRTALASNGIVFKGGRALPTYDWTTVSHE